MHKSQWFFMIFLNLSHGLPRLGFTSPCHQALLVALPRDAGLRRAEPEVAGVPRRVVADHYGPWARRPALGLGMPGCPGRTPCEFGMNMVLVCPYMEYLPTFARTKSPSYVGKYIYHTWSIWDVLHFKNSKFAVCGLMCSKTLRTLRVHDMFCQFWVDNTQVMMASLSLKKLQNCK